MIAEVATRGLNLRCWPPCGHPGSRYLKKFETNCREHLGLIFTAPLILRLPSPKHPAKCYCIHLTLNATILRREAGGWPLGGNPFGIAEPR